MTRRKEPEAFPLPMTIREHMVRTDGYAAGIEAAAKERWTCATCKASFPRLPLLANGTDPNVDVTRCSRCCELERALGMVRELEGRTAEMPNLIVAVAAKRYAEAIEAAAAVVTCPNDCPHYRHGVEGPDTAWRVKEGCDLGSDCRDDLADRIRALAKEGT